MNAGDDRGGARAHPREAARAAAGRGRRADRRHGGRPAVRRALQRELDHEPDPGALPGARVPVQHVPEQAGRAARRRDDHVPPGAERVPPGPPPLATWTSSRRSWPRPPTRRTIESKFEERYATDPWYIHLYRKSYAYHGVHPFYMWYWGAHALDYLGDVIVVGGDPKTCERIGYRAASQLPGRARDGRRDRRAVARRSATSTCRRSRSRTCADGLAQAQFADELRDVAKGWRWGRRTMTPRSALDVDAAAEALDLPDRLGAHRGRPGRPRRRSWTAR